MALFDNTTPITPRAPSPPIITTPAIIDTASMYGSFQFNGNIIGFLDGSPWACTYYGQYLGRDDVVINSNDVNDPTLKQYLKINNFELRVTSSLINEMHTGLGTSVVTGGANVYPVITPIVGDIFIAEIEAGFYGVFEVTTIERASQFKESAWAITYSQIGYRTDQAEHTYNSFVVGELFFDVTRLDNGSNPLLTETENLQHHAKADNITNLIEEYYAEYYDYPTRTFILPTTDSTLGVQYDPYLVHFWNNFIDKSFSGNHDTPIVFDTKNALISAPFNTVFDALTQQSPSILKQCVRAMRSLTTINFDANFQRHTLHVTPINSVIFPYVVSHKADTTLGNAAITAYTRTLGTAAITAITAVLATYTRQEAQTLLTLITTVGITDYTTTYTAGIPSALVQLITTHGLPVIHEIVMATQHPSYIFSNNFYHNFTGQSLLETQVTKAIHKDPVLFSDMVDIIATLPALTPLDKFYHIPFIIVLLQLAR